MRGDVNAAVGGYLRDLAFAQSTPPKMFGYKRAAAAIFRLEIPLTEFVDAGGVLTNIPGIGPGSARVIAEVLETGQSPTVERAIDASGNRPDIERRRAMRAHFLSRAEVLRILDDPSYGEPQPTQYHGDLQMHSEWSDGRDSLRQICQACEARGYAYAAVTDHSHGLAIAGGISMEEAAEQRREIEGLNASSSGRFRLLHGVEANISATGTLDLSAEEATQFEIVLAAPHSILRKTHDQTGRVLTAVRNPAVRILAHPRGRITGSRAGVVADWDAVFAACADTRVAIEIDGDPARQDLDFTLAGRALAAGCHFALDSDAHTTEQFTYAETALAHARLAGIPHERIVNCWPLDRVLAWLSDPIQER